MASLDGHEIREDSPDIILEVKYVSAEKVQARNIPKDHYYQVQSQLLATGAIYSIYIASNGPTHFQEKIYPDQKTFSEIIEAVQGFKKRMEGANVINLPRRSENVTKDEVPFVTIEDERLNDLRQLKIRIDQSTATFNMLKATLAKIYNQHPKIKGFGIKIIKSSRKGSIRYSDVPEIKLLDLEKYRSPESEVVTVTLDDEYVNHDIEFEEF